MNNTKPEYWTSNTYILDDPKINITFEELLEKSDKEVTEWIDFMRSEVLRIWDTYGIPPLSGKDEKEMIDVFNEMSSYPVAKFQKTDELDGKDNVILNPTSLGSCVNQFFPTMLKTKINYNTSVKDKGKFNGYSIYDLFLLPRFRNRMQLGGRRHFRRDSFYKYSISIEANTDMGIVPAKNGYQWIEFFNKSPKIFEGYNFWLNPVDEKSEKGSGYTEIDGSKFLSIDAEQLSELKLDGKLTKVQLANADFKATTNINQKYAIRFFKKDVRIFPHGFTAFKIGYIQVAVNFPPLIAKYLYEKYTNHIKSQKVINIYDPSSGWGGRILGAMSVRDDRRIHYIGTDPNPDNFLDHLGISRYEYLANFFNSKTYRCGFLSHENTFEEFQSGSEDIHKDPKFQKYKGQLDFIFTSPPYFNREGYSDDPKQSLMKFPQYEDWKESFLRPTLTTCVQYLKKDRYLAWNIADIKVGNEYIPLEKDSIDILEWLGMKYLGIEKMGLMNMPGANRIGEDGKPSAKNFCKVDGKWRKFEPVLLFYKPK